MNDYIDIEDRRKDYDFIQSQTFRAELGIRAIGFMYHDHSDDIKSYENVLRLKDNIEYRLFAASHQYSVFLRELTAAEEYLQILYTKNPHYAVPGTFPFKNPFLDKIETELSSIFDSIIFHLSSVFDYLSHAICYMYFTQKQNTLYWTKLSKKVRGDFKDKFFFCDVLDKIDRRFVGHLYDYRSRLLHNKRDQHKMAGVTNFSNSGIEVNVQILCSEASLKHFSLVTQNAEENKKITLAYLSSWLIRQTFIEIENLLDAIREDLKNNSSFHKNFYRAKPHGDKPGFVVALSEPGSMFAKPVSDGLWNQYKREK